MGHKICTKFKNAQNLAQRNMLTIVGARENGSD